MLPWKLRKRQILPVNQNLSSVYFSLAKFQLVSCNLSLAIIWQMTYIHKLPKLCSTAFKVYWILVKRTYIRVCWRSTIDLCLMNLPRRSSFKSVQKVYTLSKILLWIKPPYFSLENACYSWCMHQTGLFSSASVVPQSKFTGELWSSASVVPQSKSTELCS